MRPPLLIILTVVPGLLLSPMLPAEPVQMTPRIMDVKHNVFGIGLIVWDAYEVDFSLVQDVEGNHPRLIEQLRTKPGKDEWRYEIQYRSGFTKRRCPPEGCDKYRLTIHAYTRKGEAVSRNFKIEL